MSTQPTYTKEGKPDLFIAGSAAVLSIASVVFAWWSVTKVVNDEFGAYSLASVIDAVWIFFVVAEWRHVHIFDRPWITTVGGFAALIGVESVIITHAYQDSNWVLGVAGPMLPLVAKVALYYAIASTRGVSDEITASDEAKLRRARRDARRMAEEALCQAEVESIAEDAQAEAEARRQLSTLERGHRIDMALLAQQEALAMGRLQAEERLREMIGRQVHRERMIAISSSTPEEIEGGPQVVPGALAPPSAPSPALAGFGFSSCLTSPQSEASPPQGEATTSSRVKPQASAPMTHSAEAALKARLRGAKTPAEAADALIDAGVGPREATRVITSDCPHLAVKSVKQALQRRLTK